ncbi:twin-arginine translocation signal domain-containing protein [Vogesella mureinivorans]
MGTTKSRDFLTTSAVAAIALVFVVWTLPLP